METLIDSVKKQDWTGSRKAAWVLLKKEAARVGSFVVRVWVVYWLAIAAGAGLYYGVKIALVSDALIPNGRPLVYMMNVVNDEETAPVSHEGQTNDER